MSHEDHYRRLYEARRKHAEELEAALRSSTLLLRFIANNFTAHTAAAKTLSEQIAANEAVLGGKT